MTRNVNFPCPKHGLPILACRTSGPCYQERQKLRTLERHARALENAAPADAGDGSKVSDSEPEGRTGRWRDKPEVSDRELRDAVLAEREGRDSRESWTAITNAVGPRYQLTGGQVRKRLRAYDRTIAW